MSVYKEAQYNQEDNMNPQDAFNHIQPLPGFVIIDFIATVDNNKSLAEVITKSPCETQLQRTDKVLVLLDDHVIGFNFNGKYYHRIKMDNIIGILTQRNNQ